MSIFGRAMHRENGSDHHRLLLVIAVVHDVSHEQVHQYETPSTIVDMHGLSCIDSTVDFDHPPHRAVREHHLDPTGMVLGVGEMTGYDPPRLPPRALVLLPDDVHVRVDRHARAVTFPSRPTRRRRRRSDPAVRSPPPPPGTVVAIVVAATAVPPSSVGISTPTTPPPPPPSLRPPPTHVPPPPPPSSRDDDDDAAVADERHLR